MPAGPGVAELLAHVSNRSADKPSEEGAQEAFRPAATDASAAAAKLTTAEERLQGGVEWQVYLDCEHSTSGLSVFFLSPGLPL